MQSWVIGDVHGCWRTLERLLVRLELDPDVDSLWLVGDLVNRGPSSLEVLRWARAASERMGERFVAVLGNHDLHLLAAAEGVRPPSASDTLQEVLEAADGADLIEWLAHRPLAHGDGRDLLVHAGLLPSWSVEDALCRARRVSGFLRAPDARPALLDRASSAGDSEKVAASGDLAVLTSLRALSEGLEPCSFAGSPADLPPGCRPWFSWPERAAAGTRIFFGHWAALGLHLGRGVVGLDTGASWGGALTAFRREDGALRAQPLVDPL